MTPAVATSTPLNPAAGQWDRPEGCPRCLGGEDDDFLLCMDCGFELFGDDGTVLFMAPAPKGVPE